MYIISYPRPRDTQLCIYSLETRFYQPDNATPDELFTVSDRHRSPTPHADCCKKAFYFYYVFPRRRVNDNDDEHAVPRCGGFHIDNTRPFIRNQRNKEKNENTYNILKPPTTDVKL